MPRKKRYSSLQADLLPAILVSNDQFMGAWAGFIEMRQEIKKPTTPRAQSMILSKVARLSDNNVDLAIQILDQSTVNCWQDIYPLKSENQSYGGINGNAKATIAPSLPIRIHPDSEDYDKK